MRARYVSWTWFLQRSPVIRSLLVMDCSVQDSRCATTQEQANPASHIGPARTAEWLRRGRQVGQSAVPAVMYLVPTMPPISLRSSQRQLAVGTWTPGHLGAKEPRDRDRIPNQRKENTAGLLSWHAAMRLHNPVYITCRPRLACALHASDEAGRISPKHPFLCLLSPSLTVCVMCNASVKCVVFLRRG